MTQETYAKKINSILADDTLSGVDTTEAILNLTNILKEDMAEAINKTAMSGGNVSFISVPQAIKIITDGGIPTKREIMELAQEYMNEGNIRKANELMDALIKGE